MTDPETSASRLVAELKNILALFAARDQTDGELLMHPGKENEDVICARMKERGVFAGCVTRALNQYEGVLQPPPMSNARSCHQCVHCNDIHGQADLIYCGEREKNKYPDYALQCPFFQVK